ncbi:MAG: hypothetical protein KF698_02170 [Anaerolineales bacterium]|nr:hypothetical protein [Anaerolineales bacterium]
MPLVERRAILNRLEQLRGSSIVVHITSDRRSAGFEVPATTARLATEAQPFFNRALASLGKKPRLDLFLYTTGGQTDSVWPLVSIFREYSDHFSAIVPYKAHSAGTLVCLGADEIFMCEASELSPVDPTTGNQFNPLQEGAQGQQGQRKAISVEEVTAFFDLAKDPTKQNNSRGKGKARNGQEEATPVNIEKAFELLAREVHPLALGNVNRSHTQIRELASRLLGLNPQISNEEEKKQLIVNSLTEGRYSHSDILNRKEAQSLFGSETVKFLEGEERDLVSALYQEYVSLFSLEETFVLQKIIGANQRMSLKTNGAIIETSESSFLYSADMILTQHSVFPPGMQVNLQPGQGLPLIPGLPVNINVDLQAIGWSENVDGV